MTQTVLRSGGLTLALAPASGGAIAGLWLDEAGSRYALMRPMPEAATNSLHSACFPMVPFANCLRGNAFTFRGKTRHIRPNMQDTRLNFHGSGWQLPWVVAEQAAQEALMVLSADADGWSYRAEQHFRLSPDSLTITLRLCNRGAVEMPFSFGLHPWFPRHGKVLVRFEAAAFWDLMPEGEAVGLGAVPEPMNFNHSKELPRQAMNECFEGFGGKVTLEWPSLDLGLAMKSDPIFSRLMLYSPQTDPETFCVEPQSCPPCGFDALDTDPASLGAYILAPGESLEGSITLRLIRPSQRSDSP